MVGHRLILLCHPLFDDVVKETVGARPFHILRKTTRDDDSVVREDDVAGPVDDEVAREGTSVDPRHESDALLSTVEALVTPLDVRVDDALLTRCSALKVVANVAVGVDNIDLAACRRRGIRVVNTPGVLTDATAELALTLALAVRRRVTEGQALVRSGAWTGWEMTQLLGESLNGAHVVVVGAGRIGQKTAALFTALSARVSFLTRTDDDKTIFNALRTADVLTLHIPLTDDTRGWLSKARLAALPARAVVINTARGLVVDENALVDALVTKRIAGAGLDVYAHEPHVPDALLTMPHVVVLPHLGSATVSTRKAMARLALEGACAVLDGNVPTNLVC